MAVQWAVLGDVPGLISHQGRLTVQGTNFTGVAEFKFALVGTNGAGILQSFWSHNGTSVSGSEPSGQAVSLSVVRGVFSVNLGDGEVARMTEAIASSVFTNAAVLLRVWVNDGVNGWQRLIPDRRIASAGYALVAGSLLGTAPRAERFTGNLAGDVTGAQGATVVQAVGGVTASEVASGANAANAATTTSTPGVLVKRDGAGGFQAGTINATFVGQGVGLTHLTAANLIGVAPAATNFTGALSGDLSGTQAATVVGTVGGLGAAAVASGANAANAATSTNILGTLVMRDPCDGDFAAGTVRARFVGDGSGLTNLPTAPAYYAAPAGAVLASLRPQDAGLVAAGYRQIMTIPAPSWVNGGTADAPSPRSGHSAAWTGRELLVWGGVPASGAFSASGGIYNAESDHWGTMTSVGAPSARSGHTTVWTGTEMVVWGGIGTGGHLGTGGKYSAANGSWSPVATAGALTARNGHVAVWTGSRMLVWGGLNNSGLLNDGAFYDPVLNQWTPLTLPGAPEGRFGATAVWADDRMIVWGGQGRDGEINTGGQLVFVGGVPDHWLATSTTGAPFPRSGHTAVWTGAKLAIWGGSFNGTPLGDGALFCPNCDTPGAWREMASSHAPTPRFDHAAVWTGTEMLILNGANLGGELASGAAYDPETQEWRSLSPLGGPLARSRTGAVWIGTEVLVFGGRTAGQPVGSLQRLAPQPFWYFYRKL